jgi:hypothetical protein
VSNPNVEPTDEQNVEKAGFEGEAPNPPLADPGPRDGTSAEDVELPDTD